MVFRQEMVIAGRTLSIETGKLAGLAHGAVTVRYGDTIVLATATASEKPREGIDFLPLTVDFEERLYAAGKIPGGFIRREGRPSEQATLTARLTDRPLRPLFPKGLTNDVQAVVTVLSADQENRPDILSIIGASAALSISPIPFAGPVGAVRVGYTNGDFLLNPTATQLLTSSLDLIMAGTTDAVVMVEAGAKQVSEEVVLEAIRFGHRAIQEIISLQQRLVAEAGQPKWSFTPPEIPEEVREAVAAWLGSRLSEAIQQLSKSEREGAMDTLEEELISEFGERFAPKDLAHAFHEQVKRGVRASILDKSVRPDGRDLTTIRPITCEAGVLPRTHGSGLFTRGQTQALTIATLGSSDDQQTLDGLGMEESKRFLHHYNMPPFSTGEARPMRGPGRREIGHGALAERALAAVIPTEKEFPYTIRLVSEVLTSNGSTSMASVCGSTLALMDA
ncbi:MAG: polyribonucleotide nucleotidyltransferase, partial [Chloroflexi bacterium]|nr:polyribonucleotide nucleotidyltransferase [Chloroflexota bacterium]